MGFYRFMEVVPDGMVVADHQGTIEFANTAAEAMFGYQPGALVGQPLAVLMPDQTRALHDNHLQTFLAAPSRREMGSRRNLFGRRRDGSQFAVEIAISSLSLEGKPLVVAAIRDVTEHRARDEAMHKLMEVARIGRLTMESEEGAVECSPELCQLLGVGPRLSLEGLRALLHPDDVAAVDAARARLLATAESDPAIVRLRHQSGTWLHFEVTLYLERDPQGRPRRFHVLMMDVSERVKLEASHRATREQLMVAERMASIGLLAAGVAHEINNPLAAVVSNLQMAEEELARLVPRVEPLGLGQLPEELRDACEAAERVRDIVQDLKVFARHEQKTLPVDVRAVVESALRMARNEIRHRAALVTELSETSPVDGTEARLAQVFLNLVVNAAQAIPEGRVSANTIRVVLRQDPASRHVFFEVHDTGPGIAPEVLGKLFTPFFTTKPAGVGTGLGLAICRSIVETLGGELTVESTVGVGSTFRVALPPSTRVPVRATPTPSLAKATRRGQVLIIDDDGPVGVALRRLLSPTHDTQVVQSVRAAHALLDAGKRFDVILCDLMMPDETGIEFHAALAERAPEVAAKVVFVTGGAFTDAAREFLASVPNPHLDKPFDLTALLTLVNQYVG